MATQSITLKWVRKMPALINVDGFRYRRPPPAAWSEARDELRRLAEARRCTELRVPDPLYFLSHFHSDHATGLSADFAAGLVHASPITAALLREEMGLAADRIVEVPLSTRESGPRPLRVADGVEVIALDANHCPGAVMFVFRCAELDTWVLHCGDMRAGVDMIEATQAVLTTWGCPPGTLHLAYLDTTYLLSAAWDFPPQEQVLDEVRAAVRREFAAAAAAGGRAVAVVGTYQIGKERAALAVREAAGGVIAVPDDHKAKVLRLCGAWSEDLFARAVVADTTTLLTWLGQVRMDRLTDLLAEPAIRALQVTRVIGFRLTGWTFRSTRGAGALSSRREQLHRAARTPARSKDGRIVLFSLPYSEHSSYGELRDFVAAIKPHAVEPTVNAEDPDSRRRILEHLRALLPRSAIPVEGTLFAYSVAAAAPVTDQRTASPSESSDDVVIVDDDEDEEDVRATKRPRDDEDHAQPQRRGTLLAHWKP